jgi:nicotinamide-nucleotide amidase
VIDHIDSRAAHRLADGGAVLVEVLPHQDYDEEHLPGALSIPLRELTADRVRALDRDRPVVVYCYDTQCDLSARAAARLTALGFTDVHDYTASKVAWFAMGWPAEGTVADGDRAGARAVPAVTCAPDTPLADVPAPGPGGVVLVIDDDETVLGAIGRDTIDAAPDGAHTAFDVAAAAPVTVRPSITAIELARSMDRAGQDHVVVTTLEGRLLGVLERHALPGPVRRPPDTERLGELIEAAGVRVAVAESLTGGHLAAAFAAAPGASEWFRGSVVAYAATVKYRLLGVPEGPVVTEAAASAMAAGACRQLSADVGVAVTGVGGPDPQDGIAPGTVWMALHHGERVTARLEHFPGDPEAVIDATCAAAVSLVAEHLEALARDRS